MSKLILSSGERTNRPYGLSSAGIRIYSIEELCYYLFNHVYMIEDDIFCDELFDWIDTELKLPERAAKLRHLKKQKTDLKTIVTVILCSSDYYTENEIKGMLRLLDEVIGMPRVKRNYLRANIYLKNKQFKEAAIEYERLINSREAAELTPEEYGDIYHNLAVAKIHVTGFREASKLFSQAYERNHKEESLKQYLYTILLSNQEAEYSEKMEEYIVSEEQKTEITHYLEQKQEEAKYSDLMRTIDQLENMKSLGKMSEFYQQTDEMIDSWKSGLRQL